MRASGSSGPLVQRKSPQNHMSERVEILIESIRVTWRVRIGKDRSVSISKMFTMSGRQKIWLLW